MHWTAVLGVSQYQNVLLLGWKAEIYHKIAVCKVSKNPPDRKKKVLDREGLKIGHLRGNLTNGHTAQTKLSPVTAILDIWRTAEGPPSAGPPFLTLLYDHERFVPPDQYLRPIGGLGWRHKTPRIIESGEVKTGNYGLPDIFGNAYFPDMFGNYGFPNRKRLWKLGPRPWSCFLNH